MCEVVEECPVWKDFCNAIQEVVNRSITLLSVFPSPWVSMPELSYVCKLVLLYKWNPSANYFSIPAINFGCWLGLMGLPFHL